MASPSFLSGASVFIDEANSYRNLKDNEVRRLAREGAIETIIKHHMVIVIQEARRYKHSSLSFEECLIAGMNGLWKAAAKYDPELPGPFHKFARDCIWKNIATAVDHKNRWNRRQKLVCGCSVLGHLHLEAEYHIGGRDLTESYVPDSRIIAADDLLMMKDDLAYLAEHMQDIILLAKKNSSSRVFQSFLFYFRVVNQRLGEEVQEFATRIGYKKHGTVINSSKRVITLLEDKGIHSGGKEVFQLEVYVLHKLQKLTQTEVIFEGIDDAA